MILAGSLASGAALLTPDLRLMISMTASRRPFISMNRRLSAAAAFLNHAMIDKNGTAASNIRFVQTIVACPSPAYTCRLSERQPIDQFNPPAAVLDFPLTTPARLRQTRVEVA